MDPLGFTHPRPAQVRRFRRVFYGAGLRMQKALADLVRPGGKPDQLVILEHDPVFTLGRNATRADILVDPAFLARQGVSVHETDRGGEVTYHGPGQIVVYPICNLREGRQDVGRMVRGLEEAMIRTAADFGVTAQRIKGAPGIWVETPRGLEKLGAIGLHLSRWITTHGLAFNVDPFLPHFRWIVPCGFKDKGVCSLRSLLGEAAPTWDIAADHLQRHLLEVLSLEPQPVPAPSRSVSVLVWRRGLVGIEVLMMKRIPAEGGWWQSVTGMVEDGESLQEAAAREVMEETGLTGTLHPMDLQHTFLLPPTAHSLPPKGVRQEPTAQEPRFNREACYSAEAPAKPLVRLSSSEHSEFRWCPLAEAETLTPWEGARECLRRLREHLH